MAMDQEAPWERVARYVRGRRKALRLGSQGAAAQKAGVGIATWGLLETAGQERYKDFSLEKVCAALGWTPDSIDRILAGGEPVLIEPTVDELSRQMLEERYRLPKWQEVVEQIKAGEHSVVELGFSAGPGRDDQLAALSTLVMAHEARLADHEGRLGRLEKGRQRATS